RQASRGVLFRMTCFHHFVSLGSGLEDVRVRGGYKKGSKPSSFFVRPSTAKHLAERGRRSLVSQENSSVPLRRSGWEKQGLRPGGATSPPFKSGTRLRRRPARPTRR